MRSAHESNEDNIMFGNHNRRMKPLRRPKDLRHIGLDLTEVAAVPTDFQGCP
jgi:hypothetical protein